MAGIGISTVLKMLSTGARPCSWKRDPLKGFKEGFTAYVSGVAKAFDLIRNDESVAHQVLEATRETAWETWYVFADGVRIL